MSFDKNLQPPDDPTEVTRPDFDFAAARPTDPVDGEAPTVSDPTKTDESSDTPVSPASDDSAESTRSPIIRVIARTEVSAQTTSVAKSTPPWTLQQFFNGEIDLDVELIKRFPNMPLMSTIHFRSLGTKTGRGVATLETSDAGASVIIDADAATKVIQLSFTYGSMLTLRFGLGDLSDMDRSRWLELMRREQGGLAFLWGPTRWEQDYLICITRKYHTNLFAFSPHNFDAAIRMTADVTKKLLDWLEKFWKTPPASEEPPQLLTW